VSRRGANGQQLVATEVLLPLDPSAGAAVLPALPTVDAVEPVVPGVPVVPGAVEEPAVLALVSDDPAAPLLAAPSVVPSLLLPVLPAAAGLLVLSAPTVGPAAPGAPMAVVPLFRQGWVAAGLAAVVPAPGAGVAAGPAP
jgi:hypothetical protein